MLTERELQILSTITKALPMMSDRQQENFLFYADGMGAMLNDLGKREEDERKKNDSSVQATKV